MTGAIVPVDGGCTATFAGSEVQTGYTPGDYTSPLAIDQVTNEVVASEPAAGSSAAPPSLLALAPSLAQAPALAPAPAPAIERSMAAELRELKALHGEGVRSALTRRDRAALLGCKHSLSRSRSGAVSRAWSDGMI